MKTNHLSEFYNFLEDNETDFLIDYLRESVRYLVSNRNSGGVGGWGLKKDSETDIYLSALAIEAIQLSKDVEFKGKLENSLSYLQDYIENNLDLFDEEQLADCLNIISHKSPRDKGLEGKIISKLMNFRKEKGWGSPTPALTTSCRVLLSILRVEDSPQALSNTCMDILGRFQNTDGGWGSTVNSISSIIPTCYALQTIVLLGNLNIFDTRLNEMRAKGKTFLLNYLNHIGPDGLESMDTNIITIILKSMAELKEIQYEVMIKCVDTLKNRINSDGGWGSEKARSSDIENTALSAIALIVAGENKFISLNVLVSKLEDVRGNISTLEEKLKIYETDKDNLVLKESGNIKAERDKLFNKCEELDNKIIEYEKKLKEQDSKVTEQSNKIKEQELNINKYLNENKELASKIDRKWYNSEYIPRLAFGSITIITLVIVYYGIIYIYITILTTSPDLTQAPYYIILNIYIISL